MNEGSDFIPAYFTFYRCKESLTLSGPPFSVGSSPTLTPLKDDFQFHTCHSLFIYSVARRAAVSPCRTRASIAL